MFGHMGNLTFLANIKSGAEAVAGWKPALRDSIAIAMTRRFRSGCWFMNEANPTDALLRARGVSKSFPGVKALQEVDFTVRAGEVHALMGENGAGKSTLIKVLTGVYRRDAGEIFFGT